MHIDNLIADLERALAAVEALRPILPRLRAMQEAQAQPSPVEALGATAGLPLLITRKQAAAVLGACPRTLQRQEATGAFPLRRLGGLRPRYRLAELVAWITAGCPTRKDGWEWRPGHAPTPIAARLPAGRSRNGHAAGVMG